jgi:hypothetical protein
VVLYIYLALLSTLTSPLADRASIRDAIVLLGIPLVLDASSIEPLPTIARAFKTSLSPWLRISSEPEN